LSLVLVLGALPTMAAASEEPAEETASEELVLVLDEQPAEEEQPQEDEEPLTEQPLTVPEEYADFDPEDPLYDRYVTQAGAMALSQDGTSFSEYTPRALNNETLHKGIDVSAWQGSIDWAKVKASGVDFVIIRAAYRGSQYGALAKDSMLVNHITGAQKAGLKVGLYIFSQAITVEEGKEEAEYLISIAKNYQIDLPLVLDYEYVSGGRLINAKLSKQAATDICNAFCQTVEAAGYDSMVYANPSMLSSQLYPSQLGRLWLAHYTTKTSYSASTYEYWQCSGAGAVPGVSGDVDLDFWFEPNPVETSPFTDVTEQDWFYQVVMSAYEDGVVKGMTDTTFVPTGTASRGQVITMLYRMMDEPSYTQTAGYTDLTADYYKDAVNWAAENGVVNGYSDTSFGPDKAITRQDLATILYRLAGSPAVTADLSQYADSDSVSTYAAQAMAWAVEKGIISGYEDSTLRPKKQATRAEVCAMLVRYEAAVS
jgi:GH25 family lysozyme M1 (1,4-beta-N-acetylmuramidase)